MEEWRETPGGRRAHEALANELGGRWFYTFAPTPPGHPYGFTGSPGPSVVIRPTVLLEITDRKYDINQLHRLGGVLMNKPPWEKIKKEVDDSSWTKIFVFVVKTTDGLWAHATRTFEHDGEQQGPRTDRGIGPEARNSREICIRLLKQRFRTVTSTPPWHQDVLLQIPLL